MAGFGAVWDDFDFDGLQISIGEPGIYSGAGLEIKLTGGGVCAIIGGNPEI